MAATASWVIKEIATGRIIMETFDHKKVAALNTARYEAVPIVEHLVGINKAIKAVQVAESPMRDFLVTVFKALKSGALYTLVLRVTVPQTIEWVRAHVDEIVAAGVQQDSVAKLPQLPIVALHIELA